MCQRTLAQNPNSERDEYFILGTLDDYMGRLHDPRFKDRVDEYYHYEKSLAMRVDSLLKKTYPLMPLRLNADKSRYDIYSADIAAVFDEYYDFVPSGSSTMAREPILRGTLKKDIFKNNDEKLAFLSGAYARYRQDVDTAYCIRIANSASKARVCYEILKELNCKASYQILAYIPTGHAVYFHPTPRVAAYLKKYAGISDQINKDMQLMTDSIMNAHRKKN